ncbi:MAG: 4Fe-4S binding protein [Thermoguttaceae bacterium]
MFRFVLFLLLCFLGFGGIFSGDLFGAPRNPPPVFETEYVLPPMIAPLPSCAIPLRQILVVSLYSLFLVLSTIAVFLCRSRKFIIVLAIASVLIFGFYLHGCPCPVGMIQNVAAVILGISPFLSWPILLLAILPLLFALFFGRVFCSATCPLGAVQELTAFKNLRIPKGLEEGLGLFRFIWLGLGLFCVATGLGYTICRFDPYIAIFRDFSGLFPILVFSGVVLLLGVFIGRPFCRFMCPFGAILGVCSTLSAKKVSVSPGNCTKCRLCEDICPYNAILAPTVAPSAEERRSGPIYLVIAFILLPCLIALFGMFGYYIGPKFSGLHLDIQTAELVYAEEQKLVDTFGAFPETHALTQLNRSHEDVFRLAHETRTRFQRAGFWFGIWIGVVFGVKIIALIRRRHRSDYVVDPTKCVACGRCFWYCPNQKENRILLQNDFVAK